MQSPILLYQTLEGNVNVEVTFLEENFWLSQKMMAQLFGVESHTITYHLKEIFKTKELDENRTTRKIRAVQNEGNREVSRDIDFYNLDAIIAVKGKITHLEAKLKAETQYDKFRIIQDENYISDFDQTIKDINNQ